ncbi:Biotin-requiring enzyme [anaerobic digester metagenome]
MKLRMTVNGQEYEVVVEKNGGDYRVAIGDHVFKCIFKDDKVLVNGEVAPIIVEGDLEEGAKVACGDSVMELKLQQVREIEHIALEESEDGGRSESSSGAVLSPMPGKIMSVKVKVGDMVNANQVVCVLEAMKMENEVQTEAAGKVKEVKVKAGEMVEGGQILIVVEP